MKTYIDIINIAKDLGAETANDILEFLQDGQALAAAGIADEDTEAVEDACYQITNRS